MCIGQQRPASLNGKERRRIDFLLPQPAQPVLPSIRYLGALIVRICNSRELDKDIRSCTQHQLRTVDTQYYTAAHKRARLHSC